MNKLRIYACSGVGAAENREFDYWLDDTQTVSNTQAVNTLLAKINLAYTEVLCLEDLTDEQVLERLDQIDLYSVCLHFAEKYKDNSEQLNHAGHVIGSMLTAGEFFSNSFDNEERDKNLTKLIERAESLMGEEVEANSEFSKWWYDNVEDRNTVGLSKKQQAAVTEALSKGGVSGYEENADLARYLNDAGTYFLYTYFTEEQRKVLKEYNRAVVTKADTQRAVYAWCKSAFVGVYGSEQEMKDIIRAGIIKDFGKTPEDVCKKLTDETKSYFDVDGVGVGLVWTVADIVAVIGLVLGVLGTIITAICEACAKVKIAEAQQVDLETIKENMINPEDWEEIEDSWKKKNDSLLNSDMIFLGIGAVALLLLLKK